MVGVDALWGIVGIAENCGKVEEAISLFIGQLLDAFVHIEPFLMSGAREIEWRHTEDYDLDARILCYFGDLSYLTDY